MDEDAAVAGMEIEEGGELHFDPDRRVTLTSSKNVIVRGRLRMHPSSPRVVHRLVIANVNEGSFVGGGMDPIDSDIGLWVVGHGKLDIRGSSKRAWTRAATRIESGAQQVSLERDPRKWRRGDEIAIAPTASGSTAFHIATITRIDGQTVHFSPQVPSAHPKVPIGPGLGAEILNLTRNVRIEGTSAGRSHIFIRSSKRQAIKNAAIRHMGPRQSGDIVTGRYGIHFHMNGAASRGSVVGNVVVRDCGSHAFVPHNSHGISFRNCISYNTWEDAYWWDPLTTDLANPDNFTNGVSYEGCVAALARTQTQQRLTGFWLGTSTVNRSDRCVGCVAVGIQRGASGQEPGFSSGYHWPGANIGVWVFEDCVAHNNVADGIFVWQNTRTPHVIDRFIAYHNGKAGIEHGAYVNRFEYRDALLYGNAMAGVICHARSYGNSGQFRTPPARFERTTIEGAGITRVGFLEGNVHAPEAPPVIVCASNIRGVGIEFDDRAGPTPTFDVRSNC